MAKKRRIGTRRTPASEESSDEDKKASSFNASGSGDPLEEKVSTTTTIPVGHPQPDATGPSMQQPQSVSVVIKDHVTVFGGRVLSLLQKECSVDVHLSIGGTTFGAHRVVLASFSGFFKDQLGQNPQAEAMILDELEGLTKEHLRMILSLMYHGRMDFKPEEWPAIAATLSLLDIPVNEIFRRVECRSGNKIISAPGQRPGQPSPSPSSGGSGTAPTDLSLFFDAKGGGFPWFDLASMSIDEELTELTKHIEAVSQVTSLGIQTEADPPDPSVTARKNGKAQGKILVPRTPQQIAEAEKAKAAERNAKPTQGDPMSVAIAASGLADLSDEAMLVSPTSGFRKVPISSGATGVSGTKRVVRSPHAAPPLHVKKVLKWPPDPPAVGGKTASPVFRKITLPDVTMTKGKQLTAVSSAGRPIIIKSAAMTSTKTTNSASLPASPPIKKVKLSPTPAKVVKVEPDLAAGDPSFLSASTGAGATEEGDNIVIVTTEEEAAVILGLTQGTKLLSNLSPEEDGTVFTDIITAPAPAEEMVLGSDNGVIELASDVVTPPPPPPPPPPISRPRVVDILATAGSGAAGKNEARKGKQQLCHDCGISFQDHLQLVEHVKDAHGDKLHKCSKCMKSFVTLDAKRYHMYLAHQIGEAFQCSTCNYTTSKKENFHAHIQKHEGFPCTVCFKKFKTASNLALHNRIHSGMRYQCPIEGCEYYCTQLNNLKKHCASKHQTSEHGERLITIFRCQECPFSCNAAFQLKAHMDRKHAVVKRFRCTECDYASVERAAVEKHTRIRHTMERPFVCETCGFRGHTQSTIARHRRSHTKEKPHQCYICYQRFADKKRLGDHLMAHSNLKPYKCPNCTYETRRKDNLKLHIQRNHAPLAEDLARKLEAAAAAVPFHMQQAQQQYKVEPIVSEIVQEGEQVTMLTGHHEDIESSDPLLLPPEEAQEVEIEHQWVE